MTRSARHLSVVLAGLMTVLLASVSAVGASPSPSVSALPAVPAQPAASASPAASFGPVARLTWQLVSTRPHDPTAWTEGLLLDPAGGLYESTGIEGESTIREVDPMTGAIIRSAAVPDGRYGEGLALVGDHFLQLTWKDGLAYVWDAATLTSTGSFSYTGEGWGLCSDGDRLVQSDGSSSLTFRDPATFAVIGTLPVTFQGEPVDQLNELECVDGSIWSNVWETPWIVRIDARTGAVTGALDTMGIIAAAPGVDPSYLNGIAYDASSDTFLLTGKYWPSMFEVRISEG